MMQWTTLLLLLLQLTAPSQKDKPTGLPLLMLLLRRRRMPWSVRPFASTTICPCLIAHEGGEEEEAGMVPMQQKQQPEEAKWTMRWRRATLTTSTTPRHLLIFSQSWPAP